MKKFPFHDGDWFAVPLLGDVSQTVSWRGLVGAASSLAINAWELDWQWLTGTGDDVQIFAANDEFTEILRRQSQIEQDEAKALKYLSSGQYVIGDPLRGNYDYTLSKLSDVPKFGLVATSLLDNNATGNLSAAYLGAYNVTVVPLQQLSPTSIEIAFNVSNDSTLESVLHIPGHGDIPGYSHVEDAENWVASSSGPLGNVRLPDAVRNPMAQATQIISWTEVVQWDPYNE
jgi:hypothetical protein